MADDTADDVVTEGDLQRLSLLRIILMANALNETRRGAIFSDLSGEATAELCRPLVVVLRDLCNAALMDSEEAPIN